MDMNLLDNPFPELCALPDEIPEDPEKKERFQVKNKEQAEWCLRQISRLSKEQEEIEEMAKAEIEKIETWLNQETKSLQNSIEFFEYVLTEYHQRIFEKDPKTKTIKLPSGRLEARKNQPKYKQDLEQLLPWLETNKPKYVKIKRDVDWAELKKVLEFENEQGIAIDPDTGEIVPGIEVIELGTTFRVKVNK